MPRNPSRNRFDDDYDQFEEVGRSARRFKPQKDEIQDDYIENRLRRNNASRAIPESAVSRRRVVSREVDRSQNNIPVRRTRSEDRINDFKKDI